jgi:hypothetical protein
MSTVTVYNLYNEDSYTYIGLSPEEALISAVIEARKEISNLANPVIRNKYREKIIRGKYTLALDDLAVCIH